MRVGLGGLLLPPPNLIGQGRSVYLQLGGLDLRELAAGIVERVEHLRENGHLF